MVDSTTTTSKFMVYYTHTHTLWLKWIKWRYTTQQFHFFSSPDIRVISVYFISFFIVLHWIFGTHQKQIDVIHCGRECDEKRSFTILHFVLYWKGFSSENIYTLLIALRIVLIQQQNRKTLVVISFWLFTWRKKKTTKELTMKKCILIFFVPPPHFFLWALYYVNK